MALTEDEPRGASTIGDPPEALRRRARRAYELGRLRQALVIALATTPLGLLAMSRCAWSWTCAALWTALALVSAGFVFRGGPLGRGVVPGLTIGSVPLLLVALLGQLGLGCSDVGGPGGSLAPLCFAGGVMTGLLVTLRVAGESRRRVRFWLGFGAVFGLAAVMGCVTVGVGGTLGIAAGLAAGASPSLALLGRRGAG